MKRLNLTICVVGLIFGIVSTATVDSLAATPIQWRVEDGGNGHYYELIVVSGGVNWLDAKIAAEQRTYLGLSGHLATITSAAENDFITITLMSGKVTSALAGGYQPPGSPEPAGNWRWVTGEPWGYSNWRYLEPNNNGNENALQVYSSDSWCPKTWNDYPELSANLEAYIVEYEYKEANWQVVYQTDFSSDPGWITSCPDRYVWDPATGTYCFSHIMYTYSYIPIAYDPTLKYKLEFDINLTQCEWGSYFNLGLWDADMLTKGPTHWHVRYHHVDEGNSACIVYWTNDLYGGGDSPIMPFALNTWYHNKAIYDPTSDMFTLEITRKDDGVLLGTYTLAAVGEFLNIERLGISCTQSTYGDRLQAGCIDNVILSTLAARPQGDLKGRIAFVSPSEQKIYVMNADGSSRQQVPLPPLDIVHAPQWSRDGLWLTFSGGPGLNSQIYIVRPDGTGFRRVTNGSGDMVEPSFSPDGSQIAFCGPDGIALYIINTDGTGMRRLPVDGSFPRWWPLGDKILYSNWGRTYESDLFLYDCAAGQSIQITHHAAGQAFIRAAWSPNGRRLAVDFRDRNRTGNKSDVLIMKADGSNPYNFTAAWPDSDEGTACWSSDGQYILFASDRTGNFDIWYSPVDVFSPVNITNSPEDEDMPAMGTIPEAQPVYHVDAVNGNDNNNGLSRRTAFATIAKGIDSATNRYKVLVYPGVYQEEVDFKGKAITVQGVATKEGIPIIENPGDFAVSFYNDEGPRAILKNFVIKNSFMAVFIAGSSPTLKNLNIIGNKYGVEAYAGSQPDISNCIFWENSDSDLFGCEARYSFVQQDIEPPSSRGLVACWSFDETNRNILQDKSGNGHNGTIYGATWTQGIAGTGLCFDGLNDYVDVPDDGGLSLTDAVTVSAWIWLDPDWLPEGHGGAGAIVCKHYDVAGRGYALRVLKDRRLRALLEGLNFDSQSKLNLGQWTHVAFTLDPSNGMVSLYINGNKEGRGAIVGSLTSSGCELRIGDQSCYPGGTGTEVFYGVIDEALIYNRALSPREIQKLYLSQLSSDPLFADAANSDYHLLSQRGRYWPRPDVWVLDKVTSPCVDGGDPDDDPSGEPMPNGGRIDMGAFGGTPFASMSEIKWLNGDINHDGIVNMIDLAMLAENWLRDDNP